MAIFLLKTSLAFLAIIASIKCFNTESLNVKQMDDLNNHISDESIYTSNRLNKLLEVIVEALILENKLESDSSNRVSKKSWKLPTSSLKWYNQNLRKSTAPQKMYSQLYKALHWE